MCGVGARGTSIPSLPIVFAVAALAVVVWSLRAWWDARARLRRRDEELAERTTELATLHALSREILATLDPDKVFPVVARECRKVFPVDHIFLGVLDRDTHRIGISHRAPQGEPRSASLVSLEDDVASWVLREKGEIRIDDLVDDSGPLPSRRGEIPVRSLIAAPLVVEGSVTGVLAVASREAGAYDDRRLALLATIAQQAAVAIESARHHALATTDSLTGLCLRDSFFRRLRDEHARTQRYGGTFAVLMIDLDGFKRINDREGHLAGDRYLRAVGEAIRSRLRAADLACRYGGDEIGVLLPETDLAGARPIAERLRRAIAELAVDIDAGALRATASIGIAAHPEQGGDAATLLLLADQALYQAKRAGRDRVATWGSGSRPQHVLNAPPRPREEGLRQ